MLKPIIILISICSILSGVNSQCADGRVICEWQIWNPWNDCSATCGGGTRTRTRGLCCNIAHDAETCLSSCSLDRSSAFDYGACATTCYNGGAYSSSSCTCSDGFYGVCCQSEITCAHPASISNGGYTGSEVTYGAVIQYVCDDRYGMTGGDAMHTCRIADSYSLTGYWDGTVPSCVDIHTCDSNPCQNGATCIDGLGQYTCVCAEGYSGDHCQFDIQPPVYVGCSANMTVHSEEATTMVTWTEPTFEDPLGSQLIISKNYQTSEALLPWGEYVVQYVADKPSNGMRAECLFTIKVLPYPCSPLEAPVNGAFACNGWNDEYTAVCMLFCEADKNAPGGSINQFYVCGASGQWSTSPDVGCTDNRLNQVEDTHYYQSNCTSEVTTQNVIRESYMGLLNNSSWAEMCTDQRWQDQCELEAVTIIC